MSAWLMPGFVRIMLAAATATGFMFVARYFTWLASTRLRSEDGDPLDVLVISAPIQRGAAIKCRAIGLLEMTDEEGIDHKILAVPIEEVDPSSAAIKDIADLPQHFKDRLKHFFEHYKELEKGKFVKLGAFKGRA